MSIVPLSHQDREGLRDIHLGRYLDGDCYSLAIAVGRRTGWQLVGACRTGFPWVHAGARRPDGLIQDIRGAITEAEFLLRHGGERVEDVTEAQLATTDPKHLDHRIARADALLDDLFPDLPRSDRDARLLAFLEGLHALCRRHGLAIREGRPGSPPILYTAYGDEAGFGAQMGEAGAWSFDRNTGLTCDLPAVDPASPIGAFLGELHALCTERRFYVRAPFPAAQPILMPATGDEAGYKAHRLVVGGWTLQRSLPGFRQH